MTPVLCSLLLSDVINNLNFTLLQAVQAAAQTLRSLSVNKEELEAAKKGLLAELLDGYNNQVGMAESYGKQILYGKEIVTNQALAQLVQGATLGDVQVSVISNGLKYCF